MPSDLRTSYLQVFSVHSARPPKQLEHPRHWVLQLRCGQDYWVFQQCLKHRLRQLFVFVPSNLPLSFCEASQAGGIRKDLGLRTRAWAEVSAIFGLTPDKQLQCCLGLSASLGSGCPFSSRSDATVDCTDDMAGATGTKSGVRRHETIMR